MKQSPTEILRIKEAVRKRDSYRCAECGMTNAAHLQRYRRSLEVHRLHPGSWYHVETAITLCRACHGPKPRSPYGSLPRLIVDVDRALWTQHKIRACLMGVSPRELLVRLLHENLAPEIAELEAWDASPNPPDPESDHA